MSIKQLKILGNDFVDLGAQYVVGEKGNPVWEMAEPLGLLAHAKDSLSTYHLFTSDGQTLDIDKTKSLTKHIRILFLNAVNNKNNETLGTIADKEQVFVKLILIIIYFI